MHITEAHFSCGSSEELETALRVFDVGDAAKEDEKYQVETECVVPPQLRDFQDEHANPQLWPLTAH
ncbi:hypothetical protein RvY_09159 [Ramazzottius varieornatus]|uniref:Uncharacterized protein n=1 Tax=Ramazzottius varieornatus TaxID=947166 RepID=A0A1D1V8B3_RAMVA|nr:hypothetical protein RvY_09159 [Ramazzottius varieornatus]